MTSLRKDFFIKAISEHTLLRSDICLECLQISLVQVLLLLLLLLKKYISVYHLLHITCLLHIIFIKSIATKNGYHQQWKCCPSEIIPNDKCNVTLMTLDVTMKTSVQQYTKLSISDVNVSLQEIVWSVAMYLLYVV